ncbi:hypothetical protein NE865_00227 [Phthorimaea operculella]|nr:hypothetical protein NE865_00227 [Phthorimaea operculella]
MQNTNSITCGVCSKPIADQAYIQCCEENCEIAYHLDFCCGPSPPGSRDRWTCDKCRCNRNSSTPIHLARDNDDSMRFVNKNRTKFQKELSSQDNGDESSASTNELLALTAEIRFLRDDVASMNNRLTEMSGSLSKCEAGLLNVLTQLGESQARIKELEVCDAKKTAEITNLTCQVQELKEQLHSQAQSVVRNEIEIAGIPEKQNERLFHLVSLTATKAGMELQEDDIDWIMRAGPKRAPTEGQNNFPRPIVVRFVRRLKRDEFIKASKSRKNITTKGFSEAMEEKKIYINERLTRATRLLFREARSHYAAAGFKFCWVQNGFVYLRRREGSPAIRVKTQLELKEHFERISG